MSSPRNSNTRKILGSLDINSPRGKNPIGQYITPKMERVNTLPATLDQIAEFVIAREGVATRSESLGSGLEKLLQKSRELEAKFDADRQRDLEFKAKLDAESAEINKKDQAIKDEMSKVAKLKTNMFITSHKKNGTLTGAAFKQRCLGVLEELKNNNAKFLREHEISPVVEKAIARLNSK